MQFVWRKYKDLSGTKLKNLIISAPPKLFPLFIYLIQSDVSSA